MGRKLLLGLWVVASLGCGHRVHQTDDNPDQQSNTRGDGGIAGETAMGGDSGAAGSTGQAGAAGRAPATPVPDAGTLPPRRRGPARTFAL